MEFSTQTTASPHQIKTAALAVGVYAAGQLSPAADVLDRAAGGRLRAIAKTEFRGRVGSTLVLRDLQGVSAQRVVLVGLGKREEYDARAHAGAEQAFAAYCVSARLTEGVSTLAAIEVGGGSGAASIGDRATPSADLAPFPIEPAEGDHTTHFSTFDDQGGAVAMTYTLEDSYGAKCVVAGAGFLLNNEMGDFNLRPGRTDARGGHQGKTANTHAGIVASAPCTAASTVSDTSFGSSLRNSGSSASERNLPAPLILIFTAPPPLVTSISFASSWVWSASIPRCIFWACLRSLPTPAMGKMKLRVETES